MERREGKPGPQGKVHTQPHGQWRVAEGVEDSNKTAKGFKYQASARESDITFTESLLQ